ncbi:MAG: RNA polymerase sigma factor [Acidimicrobiales bacterium]
MDEVERFRALFQSNYPRLHRYARNRGLTGADADDLVAATLEVAWRRIGDVPLDDPAPWLFAVARNLWLNKRRADQRTRTLLERLDAGMVQVEASESSTTDPDVRAIRAALSRLGDDDRELLLLIAWDELTPSQAAAVLGCSPVAARTRLHRARRRLAALLGSTRMVQRFDPAGQIRIVPTASSMEESDA